MKCWPKCEYKVYTYDAAGTKLKQQLWQADTLTSTTDYVNGFVYENNALKFFGSPGGRIVKNGNNYLYNDGSELNNNTQWYEMFYRGYDPALGRMLQVDPYAVFFTSHTPYNYAGNNPVNPGFNDAAWSFIMSFWNHAMVLTEERMAQARHKAGVILTNQ